MAVWRDGVTGRLNGTAMNMTLRLNNAKALLTCHSNSEWHNDFGRKERYGFPTIEPIQAVLLMGTTSVSY